MSGTSDRPHSAFVDRRITQQQFMPLSVAAAIAFQHAQRGTKAIASPSDYIEALDMAANALARLIPIYTMDEGLHARVTVDVEQLPGEFARGATEYVCRDGSRFTGLSVVRGDLTSALSFMRRVGPTLAFALAAAKHGAAAAAEPAKEPKSEPAE